MKKTLYFLFVIFIFSCKKMTIVDPPIVIEEPLITLPSTWEKNLILSEGMTKSSGVYEYKTPLNGSPFKATAFIFNLSDTNIVISTALNTSRLTPNQWQKNESGNVLALINGGYFDLTNGQSYSLVINDSKQLSANVKALTRTFNGATTTYFPTRSAFGLTNRQPSIDWIYNVTGTTNYSYPTVSENFLNYAPQPKPSETFPAGGKIWSPQVAIGGSPTLLKNGELKITDSEELIDINNKTGRARSAIGFTSKNRVIIVAVEKNTTNGTVGASLSELALLLKDMGCVEAMNLDGGGSTCLLVNNGKETNTPETGFQRSVSSVLIIKKK
jgi:hypothetical protein